MVARSRFREKAILLVRLIEHLFGLLAGKFSSNFFKTEVGDVCDKGKRESTVRAGVAFSDSRVINNKLEDLILPRLRLFVIELGSKS